MVTNIDPSARRRRPAQKRSRETFDKICSTALELIDEGGLGALNTNAVADRAGLAINTVYAYFPDKFAIMHELLLGLNERRDAVVEQLSSDLNSNKDWHEALREAAEAMVRLHQDEPRTASFRRAIAAVPALSQLDADAVHKDARKLSQALGRRFGVDRSEARRTAEVSLQVVSTLAPLCLDDLSIDEESLRHMVLLVDSYIAAIASTSTVATG